VNSDAIVINLVVEDDLSEAVLRKILQQSLKNFYIGACFGKKGFGYIKSKIAGFNKSAKGTPFFVLADLDRNECPPLLINEWLGEPIHPNLLFRIAVRQVESWILADRNGFAKFLGISVKNLPHNPDEENDSKHALIDIVSRSRKSNLKRAILPIPGGTAKVGPAYNSELSRFIYGYWNLQNAIECSPSLRKTVLAVNMFKFVSP
jgi:hypothetical protein